MRRLLLCAALATTCLGWSGSDIETGESVEIEQGNLVRSGEDIEVYDSGDGDYHDVSVESINRYGSTVELEVYDHTTGESRVLEMED